MISFHFKFLTFVYKAPKLLVFMLMPFLFQSCKDKVDAESPRVIISSPYENETFSTVDTLDVIVKITDNEQIKSLSISLLDENYKALGVETICLL